MNDLEKLIYFNILANNAKTALDFCKREINDKLSELFEMPKTEIKLENYNDEISYQENEIISLREQNSFLGNYIYTQGFFIPVNKRQTEKPIDKIFYEKEKREFEAKNCNTFTFSKSSIDKINKKLDNVSKKSIIMAEILNLISKEDNIINQNKSYRLSSKEAEKTIDAKGIQECINEISKKKDNAVAGLDLLNMLGFHQDGLTEAIKQNQKDKIIDILLDKDNDGFRKKEDIENKISKLSLKERIELIEPLSFLQTNSKNVADSKAELKANSTYFTESIGYSVSVNDLKEKMKLTDKNIRDLVMTYSDIKVETSDKFKYKGEVEISETIFISNNAFESLNNADFEQYNLKREEQKEITNALMLANQPKNKNSYFGNKIKPKLR